MRYLILVEALALYQGEKNPQIHSSRFNRIKQELGGLYHGTT